MRKYSGASFVVLFEEAYTSHWDTILIKGIFTREAIGLSILNSPVDDASLGSADHL